MGCWKTVSYTHLILNARLFSEIINKMPNVDLTLTTDDKLLTIIKGGGAQFTILGMSADEYPEIPPVSQDHAFSIDGNVLRSMISQTLFAVSQDNATPVDVYKRQVPGGTGDIGDDTFFAAGQ